MGSFDTLFEQQQEQAEKPFERNLFDDRQQSRNESVR